MHLTKWAKVMRWLLQRRDSLDATPKLLTLEDGVDDTPDAPSGLAALPDGALSITVCSATEARETLAELRRVQQELLAAKARATGEGVAAFGENIKRQIERPGRHLRQAGTRAGNAARGLRPSAPVNRVRTSSSAIFDGLDAALLLAQTADGIDDALKVVGTALEAVGEVVSAIDIGDLGDLGF
jgi:hypothetical protein